MTQTQKNPWDEFKAVENPWDEFTAVPPEVTASGAPEVPAEDASQELFSGIKPFDPETFGRFEPEDYEFQEELRKEAFPTEEEQLLRLGRPSLYERFTTPIALGLNDVLKMSPANSPKLDQLGQTAHEEEPFDLVRGLESILQTPRKEGVAGLPEALSETSGHLVSFISQLLVLKKVMPAGKLPKIFREAFVWESQNQIAGGPLGHGAAMALTLGGIGKLPISAAGKLATETGAFAGLAIAGGGDEIDVFVAALIPGSLRLPKAFQKISARTLRKAKSPEEFRVSAAKIQSAIDKMKIQQGIKEGTEVPWKEVVANLKKLDAEMETKDRHERAKAIVEFRRSQTEQAKKPEPKDPEEVPEDLVEELAKTVEVAERAEPKAPEIGEQFVEAARAQGATEAEIAKAGGEVVDAQLTGAEPKPPPAASPEASAPVLFHGVQSTENVGSIISGGLRRETQVSNSEGQAQGYPVVLVYNEADLSTKAVSHRPGDFILSKQKNTKPRAVIVDTSGEGEPTRAEEVIIEKMVAALDKLENAGISAEEAGTSLLSGFSKPSNADRAKYARLLKAPGGREFASLMKELDRSAAFNGRSVDPAEDLLKEVRAQVGDIPVVEGRVNEDGKMELSPEAHEIVYGAKPQTPAPQASKVESSTPATGAEAPRGKLAEVAVSEKPLTEADAFIGTHVSNNIESFKAGIEQRSLGFSVARTPSERYSAPTTNEPQGTAGVVTVAVTGKGLDFEIPAHRKKIDKIVSDAEIEGKETGESFDVIARRKLREAGYAWVNGWNGGKRASPELHVINSKNVRVVSTKTLVEQATAEIAAETSPRGEPRVVYGSTPEETGHIPWYTLKLKTGVPTVFKSVTRFFTPGKSGKIGGRFFAQKPQPEYGTEFEVRDIKLENPLVLADQAHGIEREMFPGKKGDLLQEKVDFITRESFGDTVEEIIAKPEVLRAIQAIDRAIIAEAKKRGHDGIIYLQDEAVVLFEGKDPVRVVPVSPLDAALRVEVFHGGKLEGESRALTHFGSEAAARKVAKTTRGPTVFEATVAFTNPIEMKDSGRAHTPERIAEDLQAHPNNELGQLPQVIKSLQKRKGKAAAGKALVDALKLRGFDIIRYENKNEDPGSVSYITLSPGQGRVTNATDVLSEAEATRAVGPDGKAYPEIKLVRRSDPNSDKIKAMTEAVFTEAYERGQIKIEPEAVSDEAIDQYIWHITNQSLVPGKSRTDPRAVAAGRLEKSEKGGEGGEDVTDILGSAGAVTPQDPARLQMFDAINRAWPKLSPEQRKVLTESGLGGEPGRTDSDIAQRMGKTLEEFYKIKDEAFHKVRQAAELEPENETFEQARARPMRGSPRRGAAYMPNMLYPLRPAFELAGIPVRLLDKAVHIEARSMIDRVERSGGQTGIEVGETLRDVVDSQLEALGKFQPEQVDAFQELNRHPKAGWDVQDHTYRGESADNGEAFWSHDPIISLAKGTRKPANRGEASITRLAQRAELTTGQALEDAGLMNRSLDGKKRPFKKAPEGKEFNTLPHTNFHAIILRGPTNPKKNNLAGDPSDYRRVIEAYADANTLKQIGKVDKQGKEIDELNGVAEIFKGVRDTITSNDPRVGFRQIGPEIERYFHTKPSGIKSYDYPGKHIQLLVTNPRDYLRALYTSTANRIGMIEHFGQDGVAITKLKAKYEFAAGSPHNFDMAIRALSDIPFGVTNTLPMVHRPGSIDWQVWNSFLAVQDVAKQVMLTATAPVQLSEPLGIAGMVGYKHMMKGMIAALRYNNTKNPMMQRFMEGRIITRDVVDLTLTRDNPLPTINAVVNRMAGVMSRLHMNQLANEIVNESAAGFAGISRLAEIQARAEKNPTAKPREGDVHFFRLLGYTHNRSTRLAHGLGSSEEYLAAGRRATGTLVGSTNPLALKSPLRNSKAWRDFIPFTSFFSNRVNQLDTHIRLLREDVKAGRNVTNSSLKLGGFLVGVELAGVAATLIQSFVRGGWTGVEQRMHEAVEGENLGEKALSFGEFLWESFVYGSFGPIYGTFYEMALQASRSDEPTENLAKRATRVVMPVSLAFNFWDAIRGVGAYKDRDKSERATRWIKLHTPLLRTVPGVWLGNMVGMQLEDPKFKVAHDAYWRWMNDERNESVPAKGGVPGWSSDEHKSYRRHMRLAKNGIIFDGTPGDHFYKAFKAQPGDMRASILGNMYMDRPELDREKRLKLKAFMGEKSYNLLHQRDTLMRIMANREDVEYYSNQGIKQKKAKDKATGKNFDLQHERDYFKKKSSKAKEPVSMSGPSSIATALTQATPERVRQIPARRVASSGRENSPLADALAGIEGV